MGQQGLEVLVLCVLCRSPSALLKPNIANPQRAQAIPKSQAPGVRQGGMHLREVLSRQDSLCHLSRALGMEERKGLCRAALCWCAFYFC